MKEENSKFMEDFYALFNNNILNIKNDFNSFNDIFDNKNIMVFIY